MLLRTLTIVGTAAMLWVGGSIILHGLEVLGMPLLYDSFNHWAAALASLGGIAVGFVQWLINAFFSGVFGIAAGALLLPLVTRVLGPMASAVFGGEKTGESTQH